MRILEQYAMSFVGTKYQWGGDDPIGGMDCSGFVLELMRSCGVLPHGKDKINAQMIYNALEANASHNTWGLEALAFYGPDVSHINHIAFCLDQYRMIEAGGGGADTTSDEVAIQRNAFVRIRPIKYRKDFLKVIKPRYATIGVI